MTVKGRLLEEFGCAITAVLGSEEDKELNDDAELSSVVDKKDLIAIAKKVAFYIDL